MRRNADVGGCTAYLGRTAQLRRQHSRVVAATLLMLFGSLKLNATRLLAVSEKHPDINQIEN